MPLITDISVAGARSVRACLLLTALLCACSRQDTGDSGKFAPVDRIVESGISDSLYPGAVLLIGTSEGIVHQQAFGHAALYGRDSRLLAEPEPMTEGHLFDLASLTKIFATTYALMHLHSNGLLDPDEPVFRHLPPFDTDGKRKITPRHLLTHTSGLMPWFPTYYTAADSRARLEWTGRQPLAGEVGKQRRYSDIGFMALADLIREISGRPMEQYLSEHLYRPLNLQSTLFNPDPRSYPDLVSTSHGNPFEKRMVHDDEFGYRVDTDPAAWNGWRRNTLRGEVNDGNAFYTHGGIAGHAGLFSTASDLYRLLVPLSDPAETGRTGLFTPETIQLFLSGDSFQHGLGWMAGSDDRDSGFPAGSYGHTGFTGTYFFIHPGRDLILIFLTNRQHFGTGEDGYYPDLGRIQQHIAGKTIEIVNEYY